MEKKEGGSQRAKDFESNASRTSSEHEESDGDFSLDPAFMDPNSFQVFAFRMELSITTHLLH
jgi:hypothetical protein